MTDRRQREKTVRGGRRATDPPPMSTRECADTIGVSIDYIRRVIEAGELKADNLAPSGQRAFYRVHEEDFVAFLVAKKWSRIPAALLRTGTD